MPTKDSDAERKSLGLRTYSSDGHRKRYKERRQQLMQKLRDKEERDLANRLVKYSKFGITPEFYMAVSAYESKKRKPVEVSDE
jgi:hypothetical protein